MSVNPTYNGRLRTWPSTCGRLTGWTADISAVQHDKRLQVDGHFLNPTHSDRWTQVYCYDTYLHFLNFNKEYFTQYSSCLLAYFFLNPLHLNKEVCIKLVVEPKLQNMIHKNINAWIKWAQYIISLKPGVWKRLVLPGRGRGASSYPSTTNLQIQWKSCYFEVGPLQKWSSPAKNWVQISKTEWMRFWNLKIWLNWDFASIWLTKIHIFYSIYHLLDVCFFVYSEFHIIFIYFWRSKLQIATLDQKPFLSWFPSGVSDTPPTITFAKIETLWRD